MDSIAILAVIGVAVTVTALLIITILLKIGANIRDVKRHFDQLALGIPAAWEKLQSVSYTAHEIAGDTKELRRIAEDHARPTTNVAPTEPTSPTTDDTPDLAERYQHLALTVAAVIGGEYQAPDTYNQAATLGYKDGAEEVINRLRAALKAS